MFICLHMYLTLYIYIYIYMLSTYIYIYIEREREIEREMYYIFDAWPARFVHLASRNVSETFKKLFRKLLGRGL